MPWNTDAGERLPTVVRYGVALGFFLAALALRIALPPAAAGFTFLIFFPAIGLAFYACGIGPGWLAAMLSAIAALRVPALPHALATADGNAPGHEALIASVSLVVGAWIISGTVRSLRNAAGRLRDASSSAEISERRYKAMLEDQVETICRLRADGTILYVNEAFCRFFGVTSEGIIGSTWRPIPAPQDMAELNAQLAKISPQNPVVTVESRVVTAGQEVRWGKFTNRGLFDDRGVLVEIQSVGRDITERKELQEKLDLLAAETADLFNNAPCGYHSSGMDGKFLRINNTELAWLGRSREEAVGRLGLIDHLTPEGQAKFRRQLEDFKATGIIRDAVYELTSTAGVTRRVSVSATAVRDAAGSIVASRTVLHDVTEVERIRGELRQLALEQQAMLDNNLVGIVKVHDRQIVWLNKAMHRIFGYEDGEMIGQSTRMLYPSAAMFQDIGDSAYAALRPGASYRRQWEMVRKDGEKIWVDSSGALLDAEKREVLWMIIDVTAMKRHEAKLEQLASFDLLTGVLRKGQLRDHLGQAIASARRRGSRLAVLYIDLDQFKPVNDTHGHHAGDQVLKVVAERLVQLVRRNDRVVRAGGDEFVVILEDVADADAAASVAEKALRSVALPIPLDNGASVCVGASIGVSICPDDAQEIDRLLHHADQAMYRSKLDGRNRFTLFCDTGPAVSTAQWINFDAVAEVGIAVLDQQHNKLVRLAGALNDAVITQKPAPMVARLFEEFMQFLQFHFRTEEGMMEKCAYPDREHHQGMHRGLLEDIAHIRGHITHGAETVALQAIKDWLVHHVHSADLPAAGFMLRDAGIN
jgi:diguanylate cyclase (GGDEF)-like protein/hemerythrin-like metal-binding protein/PAS domain S-box-containing protein